jgi:murein DD-endopeptidase MepM/ murein hydrolase activator NlpD
MLLMHQAPNAPPSTRGRTGSRQARLGVVLATVFTLWLTFVGLVTPSSADTVSDKKKIDASIAQLRIELEDTSRDLAQAFVELHRTRALLPGARRVLAAGQAAQAVADRHREAVVTALAVAQANESKASNELLRNARASQEVQDQIGKLARDDYQQGGVSGLAIVLEASSPQDFTDRIIMMDTVMRVREATLRGLDTKRAEGKAVRFHLVAVRQQVASLKVQAEAALARATAARQNAAAAKTRLDLLFAAQTRYAATVAAKKAAELTNLNKMKARSDSLARVLAARARAARAAAAAARAAAARAGRKPTGPPSGGSGLLRFPVDAPVSSEFGIRMHPVLRIMRLHEGIDFACNCGSPVYAAADGEVIMATPEALAGGYGNQLLIDHGLQRGGIDLITTYNHLSRFVVTGGHVRAGQLVAYSGNTGTSTGCHLHFETREDGIPVNPRLWL